MSMNLEQMMTALALNSGRLRALADGVSDEQARWKPDADSWSILEVVNHLADEESADFRTRLDTLLHRPDEEPPDIDPQGWVTSRGYNQRDPAESLDRFLNERQRSLEWLRGLEALDWESAVVVGGNPFYAYPFMLRRTMVFGNEDMDAFRAKLVTFVRPGSR